MRADRHRDAGMGIVEVSIVLSLTVIVSTVAMSTMLGSQRSIAEGVRQGELRIRAQHAMERLTSTLGQALTSDAEYSPLKPSTGADSHCVRFRLLQSTDPVTGAPIYDDSLRVYVYGPDSGTTPNAGLIIGRGPDLAAIYAAGAGADALLGTTDDDASTSLGGGVPAVELLIDSRYSPSSGDMFSVDVVPAPIGRLLEITLRLNVREANGNFALADDLVLQERVTLRQ